MMTMLSKIGRLFTIKTRTEAWLVTYAIAVGAVERARHYLELYPGNGGVLLAIACTGCSTNNVRPGSSPCSCAMAFEACRCWRAGKAPPVTP